jgi:pimeloyl-ACP methyl ester carboxylesterase
MLRACFGPLSSLNRQMSICVGLAFLLLPAACGSAAGAPYTTERVTWANGDVRLAGTLYLPASGAKVPAAILLHGSGQMGRLRNAGNRVLYNHAEWLASHGVAVLFYDKRGVGESTGDFRQAGFDVLAGDAAGGLALLRAHPRIDPARIGTVGVSQGAWIATELVERGEALAFHVFVSGGAPVTPAEQEVFVQANQLRRAGLADADVADALETLQIAFAAYRTDTDAAWQALDASRAKLSQRPWWAKTPLPVAVRTDGWWRWYRSFMDYDPRPTLAKTAAPIFAAYGDADALFDIAKMRGEWDTLRAAGADVTLRVYPGLGHALRKGSGTEQPAEYWKDLEEWVAVKVKR